tara:strand:- start:21 stop:563 length:543 start_codon:yes stop_codon:yes gene_type:complete
MKNFFNNYLKILKTNFDKLDLLKISKLQKLIIETSKKNKKIIICGNGGSAATASHLAVDLTKNAKIRSINFNEYDLITCFSNDFGYEKWIQKSLEYYADKNDLLILISCSGNSKNLVNANKKAISMGLKTATLTGCNKSNKLNSFKNEVNIWINSKSYNQIEIIHHIILLMIVDNIIFNK